MGRHAHAQERAVTATPADDEVDTIRRIAETLEKLNPDAQDRIAGWVFDRYRRPAEETADGAA
jgi:hypothetical protein